MSEKILREIEEELGRRLEAEENSEDIKRNYPCSCWGE